MLRAFFVGVRMTSEQLAALSLVVTQALSGSPLSILILGLVQFLKKTGLAGNALTWVSMGLGILFGGFYMIAVSHPTDALGYFLCLVYGLLLGLIASGIYDVTMAAAEHAKGTVAAPVVVVAIQPLPVVADVPLPVIVAKTVTTYGNVATPVNAKGVK